MSTGYVSMRNEDGTQFLELAMGQCSWSDNFGDRAIVSKDIFDSINSGVADSRVNDCPDNGFFGIYNLTFHEVSK